MNNRDNKRVDDQTRLIAKSQEIEEKWNVTDAGVEELKKDVHDMEEVRSDASSGGEETTELSKSLRVLEKERDELVGKSDDARDDALYVGDDRKANSLLLDRLNRVIKKDLEIVNEIIESQDDTTLDPAIGLENTLKKLLKEAETTRKEWESSELPPILGDRPQQEDSVEPSDSHSNRAHSPSNHRGSLLDDFADPSTEPADYFGGDD